jgi:hypothetical protein
MAFSRREVKTSILRRLAAAGFRLTAESVSSDIGVSTSGVAYADLYPRREEARFP